MVERRDALREELERLRRENERLREIIAEQAKQIVELPRALKLRDQNSTTTSKPLSSDGLAGKPRQRGRRRKSRRRRGGQPGHPGHWRPLVPAERVNAVVDVAPEACRRCEAPLRRGDAVGEPRRHK